MKSAIILFSVFLLHGLFLRAQDRQQRIEFSITSGYRHVDVERQQPGIDFDFLNYAKPVRMHSLSNRGLGVEYHVNDKLHVGLTGFFFNNLKPEELDFFSDYFFSDYLGLDLMIYLKTFCMLDFEIGQHNTNPGYIDLDRNRREFQTGDLGFSFSPILRLNIFRRVEVLMMCNLGLASFLEEETWLYLKKQFSNEIQGYHYQTKLAFQPYINPRINLRIKVLEGERGVLGILYNTNFFYSERSMNYDRSVHTWTEGNTVAQKVEPPKHTFYRYEINAGIFVTIRQY
ncbi:MAG TPA: hypothetical protein PLK12_07835 [Prolixibacteraceae bacterium]|nr:hypothetical protein [Prolixibacteraceae bacterium]